MKNIRTDTAHSKLRHREDNSQDHTMISGIPGNGTQECWLPFPHSNHWPHYFSHLYIVRSSVMFCLKLYLDIIEHDTNEMRDSVLYCQPKQTWTWNKSTQKDTNNFYFILTVYFFSHFYFCVVIILFCCSISLFWISFSLQWLYFFTMLHCLAIWNLA